MFFGNTWLKESTLQKGTDFTCSAPATRQPKEKATIIRASKSQESSIHKNYLILVNNQCNIWKLICDIVLEFSGKFKLLLKKITTMRD